MSEKCRPHSFSDYREWLKVAFADEKLRNPKLSFQIAAKRLGTSRSYLKLIMEKKRHTSLDRIPKIAKMFRLDDIDQVVLTFMYLTNTVKDLELKRYFLKNLKNTKYLARHPVTYEKDLAPVKDEFIFSRWYYMAIHSLARFPDFEPTVFWIRSKLIDGPLVSDDQINHALVDLQTSGSIERTSDGWRPNKFVFRSQEGISQNEFLPYKTGTLLTSAVIDHIEKFSPNNFHMMSIGLSDDNWNLAVKASIQFRDHLISLARHSAPPDRVYFATNAMFPLTSE